MKPAKQLAQCLVGLAGVVLLSALAYSATSPPPASPSNERILTQLKQEHGFVPRAIQVIARRPATLPRFMAYGKDILAGGPLSEKEQYLVALSAAVALKSPDCIAAHSRRAKRAGATDEEITQATLIAGLISNTSALHVACDALTPTDH
jgi:AhpD family alkylhydroperoxidase